MAHDVDQRPGLATPQEVQIEPGDLPAVHVAVTGRAEQLGLDKPITVQYAKWMGLILQGNFGMAMEWGRPVSDVIGDDLASIGSGPTASTSAGSNSPRARARLSGSWVATQRSLLTVVGLMR